MKGPCAAHDVDPRGENARLIGKLLAFSGCVLMVSAIVAVFGWLPLSGAANRALALIFAVTAALDLLVGMFFLTRYRP